MSRTIRVALATAVLAGAAAVASAPAAEADSMRKATTTCPRGAVCIFNLESKTPTYVFYSYGVHRIYNMTSLKRVVNNQTGGAGATLNTGRDGSGTTVRLPANGREYPFNFLRINSVTLFR